MNKEELELESTYLLVYKNRDGSVKTYEIGKPDLKASFGNRGENRDNVGFKAFCIGRDEVRSFRHDRIVSLTKV